MALFAGQEFRISTAVVLVALATMVLPSKALLAAEGDGLWPVYQSTLRNAKYVDLTHTITPSIPVWAGFAASSFGPAKAGKDIEGFANKGDIYTYEKHGFEATEYNLKTDQLGTQLDPPAHWAPEYSALDELPATYAIRPLVVIPIVEQLKSNPNYALQVSDIEAWEKQHGRVPAGSFAALRTDMSKDWDADPERFKRAPFPAWSLAAIQFLFNERKVTAIGHESSIDSHPTSPSASHAAPAMKSSPCFGSPSGVPRNLASPMPPRMRGQSESPAGH